MMRFRHLWVLVAILFGAGLALPAEATQEINTSGSRKKQSSGDSGSSDHEATRVQVLRIVPESKNFLSVREVFLAQDETVNRINIRGAGAVWRNENRIGLGSIPLFGQVFRGTYDSDDFVPETRVGFAYGDDQRMMVELNLGPRLNYYNKFVVLNQGFSYEIEADSMAAEQNGEAPMLAHIPEIGRLFKGAAYRRDNKELVILIKPSIVFGGD